MEITCIINKRIKISQEGGYKTYYINTSLEDLMTLETENYYHISNTNG